MERFLRSHTRANSHLTFAEIGQSIQVGELKIIPLFARHGGWRYPWQYGLEARSYFVRHGKRTLYLAGDTAWGLRHRKWSNSFYEKQNSLFGTAMRSLNVNKKSFAECSMKDLQDLKVE